MQDTEDKSSPNLMYELAPGGPMLIAFTGMAHGLNELANFEFVKSTQGLTCSRVFCRDPHMAFYHLGIDDTTPSVPAIADRLSYCMNEARPSSVICVGVSAGGFAALLFGHLLRADHVHAFGPQTNLHRDWGIAHSDPTVYTCERLHTASIPPSHDYRDLQSVLSIHNGKTRYNIHVGTGKDCEQDMHHANNIASCPGVHIHRHLCDGHACSVGLIKEQGRLGQFLLEG